MYGEPLGGGEHFRFILAQDHEPNTLPLEAARRVGRTRTIGQKRYSCVRGEHSGDFPK